MNSSSSDPNFSGIDRARLPLHVAIIMDGNGRWAKKRLLNRIKGHEKGADTVRTVVETSRELGISHLTLYAFSTENWERPRVEVDALMTLLIRFLASERDNMMKNNIRLNMIGQFRRLPENVQQKLDQTMKETRSNNGLNLNLAISYGGRAELVRMVKNIATQVKENRLEIDSVNEDLVSRHLYTSEIPDPDLLIRTSGEMRISNFLLWQIAYSELFISDTLWPDFTRKEFVEIIKEFQARDRRFGRVHTP